MIHYGVVKVAQIDWARKLPHSPQTPEALLPRSPRVKGESPTLDTCRGAQAWASRSVAVREPGRRPLRGCRL